jgi:hypothetical protein
MVADRMDVVFLSVLLLVLLLLQEHFLYSSLFVVTEAAAAAACVAKDRLERGGINQLRKGGTIFHFDFVLFSRLSVRPSNGTIPPPKGNPSHKISHNNNPQHNKQNKERRGRQ